MNEKQRASILLGKCLCSVSFLDPPAPSLHLSVLWKKRRVCHRGARYRILCVLFVTQQSFSLKCEPVLVCSLWICVRALVWVCVFEVASVCLCVFVDTVCACTVFLSVEVWYYGCLCNTVCV